MEENPYMKGLQSMASAGRNTYYNDSFVDTSFDGVVCQVRPVAIKQEDYWLFQSSPTWDTKFWLNQFSKTVAHTPTWCATVPSVFWSILTSCPIQMLSLIHNKRWQIFTRSRTLYKHSVHGFPTCWSEQMAFLNSYCNTFHYSYCNTFPINYHAQLVSLLITSNWTKAYMDIKKCILE